MLVHSSESPVLKVRLVVLKYVFRVRESTMSDVVLMFRISKSDHFKSGSDSESVLSVCQHDVVRLCCLSIVITTALYYSRGGTTRTMLE